MTDAEKTLTTAEYARQTGLAVSTITRMLRDGTLRGEKRGGKWAIDASQEQARPRSAAPTQDRSAPGGRVAPPADESPTAAGDGGRLDVATFARLTYLTERGVRQWLKSGRLSGGVDADGNPLVDAANLDRPALRHLVRK